MAFDLSKHPCFNDQSRHEFGRIHLPVAPKCNIQCKFCNRDFDCVNESRPGVTSGLLSPGQALWYLKECLEEDSQIAVVGIAGPGDPFANADETIETLRLVRNEYPEMLLCVATNGLELEPYVDELASLNVTHVTVTVNAVDPEIGADVYSWVRHKKKVLRGVEGARVLWERQRSAIKKLVEKGVMVKVNTIIIPGINDHHVEEVAQVVGEMGVTILNAIPLYPVAGTPFEFLPVPTKEDVLAVREACKPHVPLMHHCTRCRADAVGILGEASSQSSHSALKKAMLLPILPEQDRPYVAIASLEGMLVNQHLGEASSYHIFKKDGDAYSLVELRPAPPSGGGADRWRKLASSLSDCRALVASNAGDTPIDALKEAGIRVLLMEGLVEEGLESVYCGKPVRSPCRSSGECHSCTGSGMGCG